MTESDAELLRRTAAGDRAAVEEVVERYAAPVFRFARALVGHDDGAEDVVQETFLAVWRNAGSFEGHDSSRAWILAIARNAANRQFRRHAGEPERLEPLEDLGSVAGWGLVDSGFEQRVADRELVRLGLETMTKDEREILVLRDIEGYSGEEVATILNLSLTAMKSRLHRARLRFLGNLRRTADA